MKPHIWKWGPEWVASPSRDCKWLVMMSRRAKENLFGDLAKNHEKLEGFLKQDAKRLLGVRS